MKTFFILFAFLLMAFSLKAQELTDSQSQYLSSVNLLKNPGFESGKASWTLTNGSSTVETTDVKQGKQSLKLTLTAQALDFYQTSTLNATAFADGVNGSVSMAIKTTVDNVYLCRTDSAGAVVASTDGTSITNCVKVSNSGKWGDYVLPVILGATSNGVRLASLTPSTAAAVAVTGDIYVDSGILEAGLRTQAVNNIGPWTTFTPTGTWTTNSTYTGKYRQVGDNYEYQINIALAGAPTSATLKVNLPTGHVIDTSKIPSSSVYPAFLGANTISFDNGVAGYVGGVVYDTTTTIQPTVINASLTSGRGDAINQVTPITFGSADAVSITVSLPIIGLSGASSVYTIPSDSFSTDSNALTHKTTAIASTDPIGTYNTYSYAINTNTKTICGTAPSILPNAADGFKIFTRAYNAASTCGNPARVEIKIGAAGTKFPTIKTDIYKSAAKVTSGSLDYFYDPGFTNALGALLNSYEESTGIYTVDLAATASTVTTHSLIFSDAVSQASGFLVINAQKAKDSIIGSFKEVVTSIGTTSPDIQSVYFGSGATCASNCTTGNCTICNQIGNKITTVSFVSTGAYNLNGIDGTKYNCTGSAFDATNSVPMFHNRVSSSSVLARVSNTGATNVSYASVKCIGKP